MQLLCTLVYMVTLQETLYNENSCKIAPFTKSITLIGAFQVVSALSPCWFLGGGRCLKGHLAIDPHSTKSLVVNIRLFILGLEYLPVFQTSCSLHGYAAESVIPPLTLSTRAAGAVETSTGNVTLVLVWIQVLRHCARQSARLDSQDHHAFPSQPRAGATAGAACIVCFALHVLRSHRA